MGDTNDRRSLLCALRDVRHALSKPRTNQWYRDALEDLERNMTESIGEKCESCEGSGSTPGIGNHVPCGDCFGTGRA